MFLFEHINGYRLIDYLVDEGITLSSDGILYWENEPIAYLGEEIIPIKGQKKRLRKALEKILEVKAMAEADEAYNSGLELGEAVAEANENAYWLGRFWKLLEGERDSISETLRRLDELPELDPSVEYESRIHEKELRRAEITIKILNELPHVRIEKKKILGIIPRYRVKLNPGYGEFFHNHLGDYTRSEIYSVLLELEDRLTGKNKESIRALRKEFEKREGISRRKKAGVLAIFLLGVAMAIGAYYLYKKWSKEVTITSTTTTPIERPDTDNDGFSDKFEADNGLDPLKPNPNVRYLYVSGIDLDNAKAIGLPLDVDGKMQLTELEFDRTVIENKDLLIIPTLVDYYKNVTSDGSISESELNKTINFSGLVNKLYGIISESTTSDLIPITDYAARLGLQLNFDEAKATNATAKAIGYYAIAVKDEGLSEELRSLKILTAGTQIEKYGDKLVDFSPIIFYSVDGNDYVLEIDKPRNTWMLAKQMYLINQTGFPIIKHPEVFEGLNGKIIANAYSLFDAKYGISYMEKEVNNRTITPTDEDVWDIIMLQWKLYSEKAFNKSALYNRDFPWYNSTQLDNLYQDKNTRRQALLFLFYLPNTTWDLENQTKVFGIEGAKVSLIQADKEYQKISELYPDGKLTHDIWGEVDLRWYYYDWVEDRGIHELENTHIQYVGLKPLELWDIITKHSLDYWNYLKDYDGLDQYLTKNWSYWDLVKAIASYERWNVGEKGGIEEMGINFIIPDTLKMFGFPTSHINIEPTPKGAANREWAISLPDYILKNIQQNDILVGPGNTFGLYACKEGLEKDNIKETYVLLPSTDKVIYLMKES